jgi:Tol biopolymer transport system component
MKRLLPALLVAAFATGAATAQAPPHQGTLVFASNRVASMWDPDLMLVGPDGRTRNITQSAGVADKDPAISPDGRRVVFSRRDERGGEDLYSIGVAGGILRRLTTTPQLYEQTPAFSPTGDAVAFVRGTLHSDDAIWILDAAGAERRLTAEEGYKEAVVWSPDGRLLAFIDVVGKLFLINRDGSGLREVMSPGLSDETVLLGWWRSGIVIGFSPAQNRFALATIDPASGDRRPLVNPCGNDYPVFSTDRRWVVCHNLGRSVRIRTRAGKRVRSINVHPRNENRQIGSYALGPGAKTLVYDALTEERHGDLWLSSARLARLTQGPGEDHSPALSLDRRRVVFLRSGYQARWQDGALHVLDVRTRRARPLKGLRGTSPSWSADGREIVYGCGHDLCVVRIGTGRPRRLTRDGNLDSDPTWSRDGKWIAFVRAARRRTTLRLIRPGGGRTRELPSSSSVGSPAWSPDGRSLAFLVGRSIVVLSLAAGKTRELVRDDDNRLSSPTWSPDGRQIAYATGWENDIPYPWHAPTARHLEIWTVDVRTGVRSPLIRSAGFNYAPSWR